MPSVLSRFRAGIPEWVKPPVRLVYYPPYRLFVRAWCEGTRIWEWLVAPTSPIPLPPPIMRFKVAGTPSRKVFLESGRAAVENLLQSLQRAGRPLSDPCFSKVLDFGCGCGRTLARLAPRFPAKKFFGADVDRTMVAWCREHVRNAEFEVTRPEPPMSCPESEFDLVFAISVFTHLDEARQLVWLAEFARILRPGGTLLLTTHGEAVWSTQPEPIINEVKRRGTLTVSTRKLQGFVPDWYQTTFHTLEWAMLTCARFFGEVTTWPNAFGFQDVCICRDPIPIVGQTAGRTRVAGPTGAPKEADLG